MICNGKVIISLNYLGGNVMATAQIYDSQHYMDEIQKGFLELYLQTLPSNGFGAAMNNTSLSSYIYSGCWGLDTVGGKKDLKIAIGTYVKPAGDNATYTVSFAIRFTSPPLVLLQMGTGNAPGNIQYRDGEMVDNITTTGFTHYSGCTERSRMAYIAIGW